MKQTFTISRKIIKGMIGSGHLHIIWRFNHSGALNKLCEIKGIDKVYDGVISEGQPYRREIADAIIRLLREIVESRR